MKINTSFLIMFFVSSSAIQAMQPNFLSNTPAAFPVLASNNPPPGAMLMNVPEKIEKKPKNIDFGFDEITYSPKSTIKTIKNICIYPGDLIHYEFFTRNEYKISAHYQNRVIGYIEFESGKYKHSINYLFIKKLFRQKGIATELFTQALLTLKEKNPLLHVQWSVGGLDGSEADSDNGYQTLETISRASLIEYYKHMCAKAQLKIPGSYGFAFGDQPLESTFEDDEKYACNMQYIFS